MTLWDVVLLLSIKSEYFSGAGPLILEPQNGQWILSQVTLFRIYLYVWNNNMLSFYSSRLMNSQVWQTPGQCYSVPADIVVVVKARDLLAHLLPRQ